MFPLRRVCNAVFETRLTVAVVEGCRPTQVQRAGQGFVDQVRRIGSLLIKSGMSRGAVAMEFESLDINAVQCGALP